MAVKIEWNDATLTPPTAWQTLFSTIVTAKKVKTGNFSGHVGRFDSSWGIYGSSLEMEIK
ncbi:hypothetical protein P8935_07035 [Telmatobacter sp. DSM 110680]|uniref:Uncharacterized protein n=1 Tax=Telmatobacter sp. DSM 110680 TaxID=3036704 RepID=A0AAU7DP39_9BACT